jgi:hypothetical protein
VKSGKEDRLMKEYYIHLKYDLNVDTTIKLFIKAYNKEQLEEQLGDDYYIVYIKEVKDMIKEETEE